MEISELFALISEVGEYLDPSEGIPRHVFFFLLNVLMMAILIINSFQM